MIRRMDSITFRFSENLDASLFIDSGQKKGKERVAAWIIKPGPTQ